MRKTAAVIVMLVTLLGLTGCSGALNKDDVEGMAKLKNACEEAGGVFTTWVTDFSQWNYKCDLSSIPDTE